MPREVRMPQLGMVQDSGVITAWLKSNGDPVKAGEPIFEVETDKTTMEVEAATDGYLSAVMAAEGDDVPVGDLIAMIVESVGDVEDASTGSPVAEPEDVAVAEAARRPDPEPEKQPIPALPKRAMPKSVASGRVLASPKARRIATERGIDLHQLRAQGVAEPIHVADLDAAFAVGRNSLLSAVVDPTAFDEILDRSWTANRTRLLASFAAGAWRATFDVSSVSVAIKDLDGRIEIVANPDRGDAGAPEDPVLTLVDLCGTRINGYVTMGGSVTLCVARSAAGYGLLLAFAESRLALSDAAALVEDIAARIENPLLQLL